MSEFGTVVQFPGSEDELRECRPPGAGDRLLAALFILTTGGVQMTRIVVYTIILLLAAVGAVSLLGR